jgi:hypothetical protein
MVPWQLQVQAGPGPSNSELLSKSGPVATNQFKVACKYCTHSFTSRGIMSHERSCLEKQKKKKETKEFAKLAVRAVEAQ